MIRAVRLPDVAPPQIVRDPAIVEVYLEDASGAPPGRAAGLARPADEAEAASLLRSTDPRATAVLCQAARTSLTGGAIPHDELVLSVERMVEIGRIETGAARATVAVGPGVRLDALRVALARAGWYYPPVPTYEQAMIGGTVATNAGGAATFKYGVTRQWIRALRVLLHNGDLLELERGRFLAARGDAFTIGLTDGTTLRVPVPDYRLPAVKKISAGYFSADPLDLIDLFIGSEGTLGLFTSITLDLVPLPAAVITALVFAPDTGSALALAAELRDAALRAREGAHAREPEVRSIESIDAHGLSLLRASGDAARLRIPIPSRARAALLFELELPDSVTAAAAERAAGLALEGREDGPAGPLDRLFRLLGRHGALDDLQIAFPADEARREALKEFREALPRRVNELLGERRRADREVKKVAGDLVVPFEHVPAMMRVYEEGFRTRGLEHAVWGHLSDGNLHPNALPRDGAEVRRAAAAIVEFADEAVRRGGAPLSEHGVGRDALKQELLRRFLGPGAIEAMRRVKRGLDPHGRFAPGVLFPPAGARSS